MCTCDEIETGTHAHRASQLGPVERSSGGLRMLNWEPQSKIPSQSPEDGLIYCILLIRIAFCHVSENLPLHYLFYVIMNIYFCFLCQNCTRRRHSFACIAKHLSLYLHILTCTSRGTHTHTSTHVQSAHKRNGNNQAQEPG